MSRQQLYADLPAELAEADELLKRYGRWARGGYSPARCGSAEGNYRAPQDDEDRQPREPEMPQTDVDRVRKSLGGLPMMTLAIVQWLYVRPASVTFWARKNGIQPQHMRERHLEGVRLFWSAWRRCENTSQKPLAVESMVV
jgi:hypothetical protein